MQTQFKNGGKEVGPGQEYTAVRSRTTKSVNTETRDLVTSKRGTGFEFENCCAPDALASKDLKIIDNVDNQVLNKPPERFLSHLAGSNPQSRDENFQTAMEFWSQVLKNSKPSRFPPIPSGRTCSSTQACRSLSFQMPPASSLHAMETIATAAWALVIQRYHSSESPASFGLKICDSDEAIETILNDSGAVPFATRTCSDVLVQNFLMNMKFQLDLISQHKHVGIHGISSLSPEAADSCRLQSVFVVQSQSRKHPEADALQNIDLATKCACPLMIKVGFAGSFIKTCALYDSNFMEPPAVDLLLHHFENALLGVMSGFGRMTGDIEISGPEDVRLLTLWNSPQDAPKECRPLLLQSLYKSTSRNQPEAIALCENDRITTYGQLDLQSSLLANIILQRKIAGPGKKIATLFEKSKFAVVAMLAILKSNALFVPLEPRFPRRKLSTMLRHAQVDSILCSQDQAHVAKDLGMIHLVVNDDVLRKQGPEMLQYEDTLECENELAYIAFTSGSTGVPKGVCISHKAICTQVLDLVERLEIDHRSRMLQIASFAFDVSIMEIFCTLLAGGIVCIPPESQRYEPREFIERHAVNVCCLTPSMAFSMDFPKVASLRVFLGGEPISKSVLRNWMPKYRVYGLYGPTETALFTHVVEFTNTDVDPLNIGRSSLAKTWIVDIENPDRLLPIGCQGELCISGPTLAAGYFNDPERNRSSFRNVAWTDTLGHWAPERVYLTGDIARFNIDGTITYVGRKLGGFIKISGNRIDPIEVAAAIHDTNALSRNIHICTVTRHSDSIDAPALLVCCFESRIAAGLNDIPGVVAMDEITRAQVNSTVQKLAERIPSYMVPALFVQWSSFPKNTSGKTDSHQLEDLLINTPFQTLMEKVTQHEQMVKSSGDWSTEEQCVRNQWMQLLSLPHSNIGKRSNFFQLGGDSASALKLIANLRSKGWTLSMASVFRFPELENMAIQMRPRDDYENLGAFDLAGHDVESRKTCLKEAASCFQIAQESIEDIYPCSPMQCHFISASIKTPGSYIYRRSFRIMPILEPEIVEAACRIFISQNALLRTRIFESHSGRIYQAVLCEREVLNTALITTQAIPPERNDDMGLNDQLCRFIKQKSGDNSILTMEIHHSVFDGHSMMLLMKQLAALITAEGQHLSQRISLPTPTSFRDFVGYILGRDRAASKDFWTEFLDGCCPSPHIDTFGVTRRSSRHVTLEYVARVPWTLPRPVGISAYLTAAWVIVNSIYTKCQEKIPFGMTFTGRDLPIKGIESIAGPTLNTVPFCHAIRDANSTIANFLLDIQRSLAACLSHQTTSEKDLKSMSKAYQRVGGFETELVIHSAEEEQYLRTDLAQCGLEVLPELETMQLDIPWSLECIPQADGVRLVVDYDVAVMNGEKALQILQKYELVLQLLESATHGDVKELIGSVM